MEMLNQRKSKANGSGVAAALLAAAGAAMAVAYIVKRTNESRPENVADRCQRAVGEIERMLVKAV